MVSEMPPNEFPAGQLRETDPQSALLPPDRSTLDRLREVADDLIVLALEHEVDPDVLDEIKNTAVLANRRFNDLDSNYLD